ncbi:MAG TPA: class I mannose-6-phosphate isomerase [Candidatus Acutalibacter pullistercoris]|uniref:Phosphohexomutase n=1 Tax=Candidatus Acutalibacter pullistercoris TaxID=2838418 RepID=A0A9D1YCT3_9FIRM|nr:class I mannose-6-phosphate isomerase [Candidatus Acutalibacter pullistercoris]
MKLEKLTPAFKDYLWGGTKLRDVYHKPCDFDKVAESWELSTHPAGESRLTGGEYDGLTLNQYIEKLGKQVLGKNTARFENFPVLIKFIDAKDPLSIQVHPSDEYALRVEHEYGKTEMWYVMDCEPGAFLYFGVNREVTREEFAQRIENNTVLEVLNKEEVHPGDVFFIESGTIHAIGAGILICEIQQNSNCTYRVYDYDRRGADGKPRELHVEKALEVSRFTPSDTASHLKPVEEVPGGTRQGLGHCQYFHTEKLEVTGEMELNVGEDSFASLIVLTGSGTAAGPENQVEFVPGDSLFVPAGTGKVTLSGPCTVVKTTVPAAE